MWARASRARGSAGGLPPRYSPSVARAETTGRGDAAALRLERLGRLQSLTEALSAAATSEEVARIVFERGLALADASAVAVFRERAPGELELIHGAGISEEFASAFRRVFLDEPVPVAAALKGEEAVWLRSRREIAALFPTLLPLAEREGVEAWAALPVSQGPWRGSIALQYGEPRAFDEEERSYLVAAARQCVQAIERARLFDAHKRLADRLQHLQLTAATLSAAATPHDVAAVAFRALGAIGACAAEIHALRGSDRLALLARYGRAPVDEAGVDPIDAPTPAAEVVRTGRALWLESPDEIEGRYPHLSAERAGREEGAWAVVPLLASGRALGALSVAFPEARRLEGDERTFVRLVAQPCAAALERSRLFEEVARSRAEAEGTAALLGGLYGAAPIGLALLDRDLRFVRVNDVFGRVDGVSPEAHPGKTPLDVLPGEAGEQLHAAVRTALRSGEAVEQVVVGETLADPGVTRRRATSAFPVRVDGEVVGVGVLLRDEA